MKNFTVLDDITQMLFIYDNDNFQKIKGGEYDFNRTVNEGSNSRTVCVSNLIDYFNKLTEETKIHHLVARFKDFWGWRNTATPNRCRQWSQHRGQWLFAALSAPKKVEQGLVSA
jgi:hypothetical protein